MILVLKVHYYHTRKHMQVIEQMLSKYDTNSIEAKKNAIKEIMQEIVLCGLARSGFFKEAAFYGGTALRIFYGLDRFSEDLDFTLIYPNNDFDFGKYFPILENEIASYGMNFKVEEKIKSFDSNIKSALLKGNTKEQFLTFYPSSSDSLKVIHNEVIKVKLEIDVNPPQFATTENKFGLLPSPYQVRVYDIPSLFAGKIHAIICRLWKERVKGRDLYDYIFYLTLGAKVNLKHLKSRLIQSNYIDDDFELTIESLKEILKEKFEAIDYLSAKSDVMPFIKDIKSLELWDKDFFIDITGRLSE